FDLFVRFGGDQVTEALSGYAQQKDSTYWWRAVEVMGRRKDENAVPGLIETLKIHKDTQTKGRILAVDDDSRDRDFYQDFLELENYQCICVDCDEKALDYLNEERFDLLISDVNHLELGGFSLFREVRRMYDCPILCISASGYSREPREQQVMQLTDAYMSKPINLREFANVVGSLIRLPLLFPNSASYIYHALEGIGPKAIPLLNPFLQDQDPYIRENVTQFIHNLENAAHN
ncbi:MAG: response regulator, partial [Nanoarchaeota archaeon]|nr:response regulator [Nanoarchaeota archaeon]